MTSDPGTLPKLKAITDPAERARAANAYIAVREDAISQARSVRDEAIRQLAAEHGVTATASMVKMTTSRVKQIRGPIEKKI